MRAQLRFGALATAVVVACKFAPGPTGISVDAPDPVPDAGLCTKLSGECAGPATLRTCLGSGQMATDTSCAWGCLGSSAHCGKLAPTGGGVVPEDLDPDALLQDIVLVGTVDSNNGSISGLRAAGN